DLQRQARSDFYRDKITARATLPKGHSVFTKTLCAKIESGGDERAVEFSVHLETEPGARSGAAQGNRGSGLFSPDQGLGEADGNRRPRGADFPAGRFGIVGAIGRAAGYLHRAKVSVVQSLLCDGHASEGERSRLDHREPSFVFRR